MKYINELKEGDRITEIYLCKTHTSATTKTGKSYDNVVLQDKTGMVDAKIWEPNSPGIESFDSKDYVKINGEVTSFNGALQVNIRRLAKCKESEVDTSEFFPVSEKDIESMYDELMKIIDSVSNTYLSKLLNSFFREDEAFIKRFKANTAAKSVHHGFIGGLLEHTLSVAKLCEFYTTAYPILNHDLLISAAICHDIGKTREISLFPENDYTDEGQLLGHIVMGAQMVSERAKAITDFPVKLSSELQHCILAHHGEYEFGSPKKPALIEAVALNFADNTDAKLETFKEALANAKEPGWLGFNKFLDSNIRPTDM